MKKTTLLEFIKKYSINTIEKSRWVSNAKDKTLKVSVLDDTKNILSDVTLSNWDGFGDAEVGVGDTDKFKRELGGIYGEDIELNINYNSDKSRIISIDVMDGQMVGTLVTSDLDMIPKSSKISKLPDFNAEIIFDAEFKDRFLKAKASLPLVESFTVMMNKKGNLELVIGYSNINSSKHSLKVKTNPNLDKVDEPMHFNALFLKEILSVNSEAGDTVLKVSDSGLAAISFVTGDISSNYYLSPLDNQD